MEVKRRKFQGVLNILSFNRHFYIFGLFALLLVIVSQIVLQWPDVLFWIVILAFLYGLLMPLIVSAYVYDFSGYYHFDWLKKTGISNSNPDLILNINAGFDETSFILESHFPQATLKVFDFYNPEKHTEQAIIRARKVSLTFPDTAQIATDFIPLDDKSVDIIFLLSAAHEIRSQQEKIVFLKECYRLCKPTGQVIMVEHLRDLPNFIAFSIGFTHFFSRRVWRKAFKTAGFSSLSETKFTTFMSVFTCCP
jgi:ubiquinone/menaquinone biosynthesis C-methylase UbiE